MEYKRVACLYRVSSKKQVEKDDIPMQRIVCREYIEILRRLREIILEEEHQKFVDQIASRIENGYTRWSYPKASFNKDDGKPTKQYFDKKEDHINDSNDTEWIEFRWMGDIK